MGILDKISGKKAKESAKKSAPKAKKAPAETAAKTKAPAEKAETAKVRGPLAKEGAGEAYRILVRPVLTEKTSQLQAINQYTFAVAKGATKVDVARAVRDLYGVKPLSVRIVNAKGKKVRSGRSQGQEKDVKKAVVTLKAGETLTVLE